MDPETHDAESHDAELRPPGRLRKKSLITLLGNKSLLFFEELLLTQGEFTIMSPNLKKPYRRHPDAKISDIARAVIEDAIAGGNTILPSFAIGESRSTWYRLADIVKKLGYAPNAETYRPGSRSGDTFMEPIPGSKFGPAVLATATGDSEARKDLVEPPEPVPTGLLSTHSYGTRGQTARQSQAPATAESSSAAQKRAAQAAAEASNRGQSGGPSNPVPTRGRPASAFHHHTTRQAPRAHSSSSASSCIIVSRTDRGHSDAGKDSGSEVSEHLGSSRGHERSSSVQSRPAEQAEASEMQRQHRPLVTGQGDSHENGRRGADHGHEHRGEAPLVDYMLPPWMGREGSPFPPRNPTLHAHSVIVPHRPASPEHDHYHGQGQGHVGASVIHVSGSARTHRGRGSSSEGPRHGRAQVRRGDESEDDWY